MPKTASDIALLKRVLTEIRACRLPLAGLLAVSFLTSPLKLLGPLPLAIAIDSVIGDQALPGIIPALLPAAIIGSKTAVLLGAVALLVAVALVGQLQSMGYTLLRAYIGERMVLSFRAKLFRHAQRLSLTYHDMKGTADSVYRVQGDAMAIQYLTIDGILPLITSVFTLAAMLYVTLRIDTGLTLVAMTIAPFLFVISRISRPRLRTHSRRVKKLESSNLSVVQEVLGVIRVVKAFGREDHEQQRYIQGSADGMRARMRKTLIEGWYSLSVGMTTTVGTAVVMWIGVRHIQSGFLTVGDLLLVLSYIGQLYDPLRTIGKNSASLQGHFASLERAFALLDERPEVVERRNALPIVRSRGEVQLENITFSYDGTHRVLSNVSLTVPPGTRVGIQGRTGAGKSTLISLLMRFYDIDSGRIVLDGLDIRDYRVADLRNQFAIVLQDSVLFSTTIAQNIAYGRLNATEEEIVLAAKSAHAHDFISHLPNGYQTLVGERGMSLSGGERQRIALARAFLKNAPILILDEPTSALDLRTEASIIEALQRLMQGRTTFIIAHRLSTLDHCDLRLEIRDHGLMNLQEEVAIDR